MRVLLWVVHHFTLEEDIFWVRHRVICHIRTYVCYIYIYIEDDADKLPKQFTNCQLQELTKQSVLPGGHFLASDVNRLTQEQTAWLTARSHVNMLFIISLHLFIYNWTCVVSCFKVSFYLPFESSRNNKAKCTNNYSRTSECILCTKGRK
jgi:hypothetical protein